MFKADLVLSLSHLWNQPFFCGALEIDLTDQDLGPGCAPGYWSIIASRPCQHSWGIKKIHMCIYLYYLCLCTYIHTYTYIDTPTHIYIHFYIFASMCIKTHEFMSSHYLLKFQSSTSNSNTTFYLFLFPYFIWNWFPFSTLMFHLFAQS